jgi:hypothetical protein
VRKKTAEREREREIEKRNGTTQFIIVIEGVYVSGYFCLLMMISLLGKNKYFGLNLCCLMS